jgi:hypothetical protein
LLKKKKKSREPGISPNQSFWRLVQTFLLKSLNLRAMRIPKASEDNN